MILSAVFPHVSKDIANILSTVKENEWASRLMKEDKKGKLLSKLFKAVVEKTAWQTNAGLKTVAEDAEAKLHNKKKKLSDKAKEFLATKGFDPEFGARPLGRAIQKYLEDPIAEEILKAGTNEGDTVDVDMEEGAEELKIKLKKARKKKEDVGEI